MSNLFDDKTPMPGNADVIMATPDSKAVDTSVLICQTLRELHVSRRADDGQGVRNLVRPRRGHDY